MNNTASAVPDNERLLAAGQEAMGLGGQAPQPEYLPVTQPTDGATVAAVATEAAKATRATEAAEAVEAMAKGQRLDQERIAREAEARRPHFVRPAEGAFTSGYGGRWGTTHWGIDIANSIGTPIVAAADGVVVESGPASGFGLWVRIRHEDGMTTVYGHINRSLVEEGERVKAGEEIAEMGNRGNSTGPHLHFEVWTPGGEKINPLTWLEKHGISL